MTAAPATGSSSDLAGLVSLVVALVVVKIVAWIWDRLSARFEPVAPTQ